MDTNYKGFLIQTVNSSAEVCANEIQNHASTGRHFFANTLEIAKKIIDDGRWTVGKWYAALAEPKPTKLIEIQLTDGVKTVTGHGRCETTAIMSAAFKAGDGDLTPNLEAALMIHQGTPADHVAHIVGDWGDYPTLSSTLPREPRGALENYLTLAQWAGAWRVASIGFSYAPPSMIGDRIMAEA